MTTYNIKPGRYFARPFKGLFDFRFKPKARTFKITIQAFERKDNTNPERCFEFTTLIGFRYTLLNDACNAYALGARLNPHTGEIQLTSIWYIGSQKRYGAEKAIELPKRFSTVEAQDIALCSIENGATFQVTFRPDYKKNIFHIGIDNGLQIIWDKCAIPDLNSIIAGRTMPQHPKGATNKFVLNIVEEKPLLVAYAYRERHTRNLSTDSNVSSV